MIIISTSYLAFPLLASSSLKGLSDPASTVSSVIALAIYCRKSSVGLSAFASVEKQFPSEQRVIVGVDVGYYRALEMRKSRVVVMVNRLDLPLWSVFRILKGYLRRTVLLWSRNPCSDSLVIQVRNNAS